MALPAVMAIEGGAGDDERSLTEMGWRHVGTRITYSGDVEHVKDSRVRIEAGEKIDWIASCNFNGRLWRDEKIDIWRAFHETKEYLSRKAIRCIGSYPASFIIFEENTIKLIGTHPAARGLGLATRLIRHCSQGTVTAGTYSDNVAAIALYEGLGMEKINTEEVYHKP